MAVVIDGYCWRSGTTCLKIFNTFVDIILPPIQPKVLKKKNQKSLYEALLKIKEELMLLGFISLLLTAFQEKINKMCIPKHLADNWLPCNKQDLYTTTSHFSLYSSSPSIGRRLLAESPAAADYCTSKIRQWKSWEDYVLKVEYNTEEDVRSKVITRVQDHTFIRDRFIGIGKDSTLMGWLLSFFKQFFASVTKSDYTTLRFGFIMTHCRGNPKFNFHKYMLRSLEADVKKVVGMSWYLWLVVVVFLLLNIHGWHAYFYISFIPLILLLVVGTKLEHVINRLAQEVAEKHVAIEGNLVVQPSDDHFWFNKPQLVLLLIHIILFQNSFEIAIFFWVLVQYGFDSCIMGHVGYVIPRIVIGVFIQLFCSYSTLPLYAIVTQMGSSFKKSIFEEHIQEGIVDWAQKAKKNKLLKKVSDGSS